MNNLPAEILQNIFLFLHQEDKVECMTVCRHWNQAMEDSVLFDTLCLYTNQQFYDIMSKYHRDMSQSKKIGRLVIHTNTLESRQINTLLLVASNLRELRFYEGDENRNLFNKTITPPYPWYNTIKVIKEKSHHVFTYRILEAGVLSVLTDLSVEGTINALTRDFIELLINTPVLKLLSLRNFRVSLADLELLHTNVPLLSSFELSYSVIDSTALLPEIHSAPLVIRLSMYCVHVPTTSAYKNLQKYFSIKYSSITEMTHDISVEGPYDKKGLCAFCIKEIGPHLTSLKIGPTTNPLFIISRLAYLNCRIREFEMCSPKESYGVYEPLLSDPPLYIQSLSLKYSSVDNSVEFLQLSSLVTELSLKCDSAEAAVIDISVLLESVGGTLKTLRISQAILSFNSEFIQEYLGLKNITLKYCTIRNRIDHYISKSFPKLQTLIIYGRAWAGSTLYFGGLNLDYLEVRYKLRCYKAYVLLVTTSNNEERLYTAKPVSGERAHSTIDSILSPAVKSFPFGKSSIFPDKTLICSSVRNFYFVVTEQ